ncbi:MAG: HPP family protein [Sphingopyxis macrogoltabida]|uniref:HPP family protein n=1 Tax=Sphingopyxis macrogoltabida TaxID=33050 RepID=A0A2W5L7K2_SPHMC|nr:MAG: HPP family protein [Sphingopyxis macrogoltabida]
MLIAPIGASALLLFAIPSSPLAQPWAIIGGNVVSALVGVMTVKAAPSLPIAAGLSVGLSLAAMSVLRCLHPPGGSMALTAVVGGEATRQMGFNFPFLVVGTSSCALVLIGIAFHALVKRTYPHRTLTADTAVEQSAFCAADIDGALRDVGEVFDISKQDLEMIVRKVELNAAERRRNSRSR